MAVTKEVYTATATWTAASLATIFEDAFIDAGLMTAWHDSFTSSGIENRVLKVVYDASKTYGTTYYWFMFTTSNVYLNTAGDWDAVGHVPAGTIYLDYYSTTTNSTTNHNTLSSSSLSASTQSTLTRYTSAIETGCSWFLFKNGTNTITFSVPTPSFGPASWVDLDYYLYNYVPFANSESSSGAVALTFEHWAGNLRTSIFGAAYLRGFTSASAAKLTFGIGGFFGGGNQSNSSNNYPNSSFLERAIYLPVSKANTNTNLTADHVPVFTGPPINPYTSNQPSEFGVTLQHEITSASEGDTYVVSSGAEEYEIIKKAGSNVSGYAQIFLLARTV